MEEERGSFQKSLWLIKGSMDPRMSKEDLHEKFQPVGEVRRIERQTDPPRNDGHSDLLLPLISSPGSQRRDPTRSNRSKVLFASQSRLVLRYSSTYIQRGEDTQVMRVVSSAFPRRFRCVRGDGRRATSPKSRRHRSSTSF